MRYYMQQKIRYESCKKKSCKKTRKRIPETHRDRVHLSVQPHHHSKKKHSACQNADSKKCAGKCIQKSGYSQIPRSGIFSIPLILLVKFYRIAISPLFPPCCRFSPTCSMYAIQALSVHGLFKGSLLTAWRIMRCNPFVKGGYDPVPQKGFWRPQQSDKED